MKKFLLAFLFLLPLYGWSQQNLKTIRKSSWQTLVYSITAIDAEQFIKWDSIPINRFENATPVLTAYSDLLETDSLPIGHYVQLNIIDNNVNAVLFNNTNLLVLTINNKNRLQLDVRTKTGALQTEAQAFLKDHEIKFNTDSKTFWINNHKLDEAVVKVCTPGDTTFIELAATENYHRSISEQRRQYYRVSKIYKILNWLPAKIKSIFKLKNKWRSNRIGASGYIIFNQPKYKPLDTVKFKGYVVDKKWRQYKKPVDVYLSYYANGKSANQLLYTLQPLTDGAFTGEFVVVDSIPIDIRCELYFRTASKKDILHNSFKIEDYVLDDMGSFSFKADKFNYYKNDSIYFSASSKDANGLNVMDAAATLIVTTSGITGFYKDSLFVVDTLYREEKKLLTTTDTKFAVATNNFPAADFLVNAKLIFKNSNNELHEENETVHFIYKASDIIITQEADSIRAVFKQNGKEVANEGEVEMNDNDPVKIQFPYSAKIDPIAEDYTFYAKDKTTGKQIKNETKIEDDYRLSFSHISKGDTLGFNLGNPYKIPVYFSVFYGNKLVATGKQADAIIKWQKIMRDRRKAYKVRWQYIWAGEEKKGEEGIGLLYKLLSIKISSSETVFPGQKDSVKIEVKDYKGIPVANVNLTAVGYNNQLAKDINVATPPYLARYRRKNYLLREGFENDGDYLLSEKYQLGKNKAWINKFHLDSMTYYKLLFPEAPYFDAVTLTDEILPQLSVNVVKQGVPQEIYLLYINRNLVYYNGVTDKANYSFTVLPENVQIGIRLKDKYIEIDSLYMQPHYKHDLSFDLDNLPPYSTVTTVEKYWSNAELELLERTMLQMKDSYISNYAFVWQNNTVVTLKGNGSHLVGPFTSAGMTFYNPGNFDISFSFEHGYEYSLSKQVARLEKKNIFTDKVHKNFLQYYNSAFLKLGDTIIASPEIAYNLPARLRYLTTSSNAGDYLYYAIPKIGKGRLLYTSKKDTIILYTVLQSVVDTVQPIILNYVQDKINNIEPGTYHLYLVTNHFYTLGVKNIMINKDGTTCIKTDSVKFVADNSYIDRLINKELTIATAVIKSKSLEPEKVYTMPDNAIYVTSNGATITGRVTDGKGKNPIPGASVVIKGSNIATQCDAAGNFTLGNLRSGKHILVFMSVGYKTEEVVTEVRANQNISLQVSLKVSVSYLSEVVVIGYGTSKRKDMTGSINSIALNEIRMTNINQALAGKVAGIQLRGQSGVALTSSGTIRLHGATSLSNGSMLLYVIDGIVYREVPKNFNTDSVSEVTMLNAEQAMALFGPDGANGAMVVTTKTKTFRKSFRDYAFWQPNFFTDKNGAASFEVTYPDNITGWRTYVVAMDKKRRIGKASVLTQSYKPIVAQLSVPQFLIAGDSAVVIGKAVNYTADQYNIAAVFNINGAEKNRISQPLPANQSLNNEQFIFAVTDTIKAAYTIATTTGFKDGEERTIPVFKKGIEEAAGNFWVLQNDTTIHFSAAANSRELNIYAQNNTLDVLLNEVEHLKQYPYYCMEQTASKLIGYAMEKKIKEQLNQPFKNEGEINRLITKLQKAQQFDGGWAWWEKGKTNFYITNYIAAALSNYRANALVETNVRNAFLFLQNQLPFLKRDELLAALTTLSKGRHEMNYEEWIKQIHYDSLTQHQQWQWVAICQQQKLNYQKELKVLVDKKIETQLGGAHWGIENYNWYSNDIATTVIAFTVLQNEAAYKNLLPSVIQYFLNKRKGGYWINTVESASIVSTIMPFVLEQQKNFMQPATLQITGDTSFTVSKFPFEWHAKNTAVKNINITKAGGGLVYCTAYQKIFNNNPLPVNDKFIVQTLFQKNGQTVTAIKSGEKIKMIVTVNVLKDADYVMLEVPIPAGCNYATKNNSDWQTYKEFYKNKMVLYAETLKSGKHQFEIELEPRYNGTYTLNPAKAELMYYPIFYGRNEMKKVTIVK